MDALRRSVQQAGTAPAQPKNAKKRIEGQKEMLLPIEGKKPTREAAKRPARTSGKQRKAG